MCSAALSRGRPKNIGASIAASACRPTGNRHSRLKSERPLADLDTTVRKLLDIAHVVQPDHAGRIHIGPVNRQLLEAGASVPEYTAAPKAAIDRGYLTLHPPGAYMTFTQAGADLFA